MLKFSTNKKQVEDREGRRIYRILLGYNYSGRHCFENEWLVASCLGMTWLRKPKCSEIQKCV